MSHNWKDNLGIAVVLTTVMIFIISGCMPTQTIISSNPEGASVYINDKYVGQTPMSTEEFWRHVKTAGGKHDFISNAFESPVKVRYSKNGHDSIEYNIYGYFPGGPLGRGLPKHDLPVSEYKADTYKIRQEAIVDKSKADMDKSFTKKPETIIDQPAIGFGRYYALVVGNNNYLSLPKLLTARNDAQTVANILLNDYEFNVTLLLDAKRSDILVALGKLREKLSKQDNLLIYYAGHGWLDKEGDEGYWLPVDATKDNEINWISNASITTQLKAMEAKHVLIVADSCYSGKLGRSIHIQKRTPDYYSRIAQKRARSVIASGGLEPVIDSGGKGDHSIFASAFIQALQENRDIVDTSELFNQIRRPVLLNADQTPEYSDISKAGHDGGEFVFIRKK